MLHRYLQAALFTRMRDETAKTLSETGARRPGDWLRRLRRCLSRYCSDGDRRQEEGRLSPAVC